LLACPTDWTDFLIAIEVYRDGLARIEDRWEGRNERERRTDTAESLYAADLDLFGPGSLFELLCTARTRMGEDTLVKWLLAPASPREIQERHAALSELRDRLDLRDVHARAAKEAGLKLTVSSDAHSISAQNYVELGIGQARRGWLTKNDVVNTRTWKQVEKLRRKRA